MKRLLIIVITTLLISCTTTNHVKDLNVDKQYEHYQKVTMDSIQNGWASYHVTIRDGSYDRIHNIESDRTWYQGFYWIYLGLEYKRTGNEDIIKYAQAAVDSLMTVIDRTGGIFLRDVSEASIITYLGGKTDIEASKDQIISMVCGLFFLYYNIPDKDLRSSIKSITYVLDKNLNKYGYLLYNEKANRFYNSAFYVIANYYGVSRANAYILGKLGCFNDENIIERAFKEFAFEMLKYKRRLIDKKIYIGDINILQIEELQNEKWYKQLIQSDEFSVNLHFFELLIGATLDKGTAVRIIRILEHEEVMKLKHLNLAALYFYCGRIWNLRLGKEDFYIMVLRRDRFYYSYSHIVPNSLKWGNDVWPPDTVNGFIQRNFTLQFDDSWDWMSEYNKNSTEDLIQYSKDNNRRIDIDTGLLKLVRTLLTGGIK